MLALALKGKEVLVVISAILVSAETSGMKCGHDGLHRARYICQSVNASRTYFHLKCSLSATFCPESFEP